MNSRFSLPLLVALGVASALPLQAQTTPVPRPDHVVIVIEENHEEPQIIGNTDAPYINFLANQGALFIQSFAVNHPSQPNYLQIFSGSNQGCTNDSVPPAGAQYTTANLGAELLAKGLTFGGYSLTQPNIGFLGKSSGAYVRKHNPWSAWQGTGPNQLPPTVSMPFTSFPADYSTLPTISFVIPDLDSDMHSGSVASGDSWLKNNLDAYIQWAKTHNSLFILTFDEDDFTDVNQITTFFVGPMVKQGQYSEHISHHNVLRTLEDMYGLGHAGAAAAATPIVGVWTGTKPPPPTCSGVDATGDPVRVSPSVRYGKASARTRRQRGSAASVALSASGNPVRPHSHPGTCHASTSARREACPVHLHSEPGGVWQEHNPPAMRHARDAG